MGGQFFPNGQGTAVEGGYRLSGAWSFGSGTGHAEYVAAGFLPMDDGEMRWISEGLPDMQVAVLPRDEVIFDDGWHVQGLKGTGSYDYQRRGRVRARAPDLRAVHHASRTGARRRRSGWD